MHGLVETAVCTDRPTTFEKFSEVLNGTITNFFSTYQKNCPRHISRIPRNFMPEIKSFAAIKV